MILLNHNWTNILVKVVYSYLAAVIMMAVLKPGTMVLTIGVQQSMIHQQDMNHQATTRTKVHIISRYIS